MGGWTCTEDVHTQDGPKDTGLCSSDSQPALVGTLEGTWNYLSHPPGTSELQENLWLEFGFGKGGGAQKIQTSPRLLLLLCSSSLSFPLSAGALVFLWFLGNLPRHWCWSWCCGPAPPSRSCSSQCDLAGLRCSVESGGAVGGNEAESSGPQRQALNHRPLAQAALSIPRMINCSLSAGRKRAR